MQRTHAWENEILHLAHSRVLILPLHASSRYESPGRPQRSSRRGQRGRSRAPHAPQPTGDEPYPVTDPRGGRRSDHGPRRPQAGAHAPRPGTAGAGPATGGPGPRPVQHPRDHPTGQAGALLHPAFQQHPGRRSGHPHTGNLQQGSATLYPALRPGIGHRRRSPAAEPHRPLHRRLVLDGARGQDPATAHHPLRRPGPPGASDLRRRHHPAALRRLPPTSAYRAADSTTARWTKPWESWG